MGEIVKRKEPEGGSAELVHVTKKQKLVIEAESASDALPTTTNTHEDGPPKVGETELASAFALASLAGMKNTRKPEQTADITDEASMTSLEHPSMTSLEHRSPKSDPVPISPEARSPMRLPPNSKRVTFAANIKEPTRTGPRRYSVPPRTASRMPPQFRPPMAGRMPPHMRPPWRQPPTASPYPWVCDFCNVASFATYPEAVAHEQVCRVHSAAATQDFNNRPAPAHWSRQPFMPRSMHRMPYRTPPPPPQNMAMVSPMNGMGGRGPIHMSPSNHSLANTPGFVGKLSLSIPESDSEWLSPLNCFIRQNCVEAFAVEHTGAARQVGIRCCYCADQPADKQEIAAVAYPSTVNGIYDAVKSWQRVHLLVCKHVPEEDRKTLAQLHTEQAWMPSTRPYWTNSAKSLGLVDTVQGIRFSREPDGKIPRTLPFQPPPSPRADREPTSASSTGGSSETGTHEKAVDAIGMGELLVYPTDATMVPPYVYFLMHQVESCTYTEVDRFVARSKGPVGYPGFQCRHCHGHAGLGKYFPVTSKSLATNSTSQNLHAHLLKCRQCPPHLQHQLTTLKEEKRKAPRLEPGWRKVFFDKIWVRLHGANAKTTNV